MFKLRKIALLLAMILTLSLTATACDKPDDSAEETSTASLNVITSASEGESSEEDSASETTVASTEIVYVTDENGETVTGFSGKPLIVPPTIDPNAQTTVDPNAPPPEISQDISIESSKKYGYQQLSTAEQELYDKIVEAAYRMATSIQGYDDWKQEDWVKVFGVVYNQEPQIFWLSTKTSVGRINYLTMDGYQIEEMQQNVLANSQIVLDRAAKVSSTYEKLKIFHDYISLNTTFEKNEDGAAYNGSIYGAFGHKEGEQGSLQCAGYAKAMQYLCDKAGITSMVVTGENEDQFSHAWNVVDVDGEWYNLDTTWDDPILATPVYNHVRYSFFLVPDEWIHDQSHFLVNEVRLGDYGIIKYFDPPACTATSQNYFVKNDMVYDNFEDADAAIKAEIDKAIASGLRAAHIMVSSEALYDEMYNNRSSYSTYAKGVSSEVSGIADNSKKNILVVQYDIKY